MEQSVDGGGDLVAPSERQHQPAEVVLHFEGVVVLRARTADAAPERVAERTEALERRVREPIFAADLPEQSVELGCERLELLENGYRREAPFVLQISEETAHDAGL